MARLALSLLALCAGVALADDSRHQPRTLGNTAVMHVYYYAPATLEVTYVDSYLFKDVGACTAAVPQAAMFAEPLASAGDLVDIQCVALHPPAHTPPRLSSPGT